MSNIKVDFHTHTKYSIEPATLGFFRARARYGPEKLVENARAKGLNAVNITDHDVFHAAELGEKYVKKKGYEDFTVVKGEEVSSKSGHIVAVGIEERVKPGLSAEETVDKITEQGGAVIIPHPFIVYGVKDLIFKLKRISGVEIFNPFAGLIHKANLKAKEARSFLNLSSIGSSDAHTLSVVGRAFTNLKCDLNVDSIVKAIKRHQTEASWNMKLPRLMSNGLEHFGLCFFDWYNKPKQPLV